MALKFTIEGAAEILVVRDTEISAPENDIVAADPQAILFYDHEALYESTPKIKIHKNMLDRGVLEYSYGTFILSECIDSSNVPFTADSFILWANDNIGKTGSGGGVVPAGAATEQKQDDMIAVLQDIDTGIGDLEALATSQLAELQAINLNTDGLEALLASIDSNTADLSLILAELQTQTGILNTHTTTLNSIVTAITTADTNNVTELQAIQTQLAAQITELQAINANTSPLEASLTAIENAINTQAGLTLAELQTIVGQLNTVITELQTINATLTSIEGQFTGTCVWTNAVITGNPAYLVPGATYKSIQLTVVSGTITKGAVAYPEGVWTINGNLNKTINTATFDATLGTGFVDFLA